MTGGQDALTLAITLADHPLGAVSAARSALQSTASSAKRELKPHPMTDEIDAFVRSKGKARAQEVSDESADDGARITVSTPVCISLDRGCSIYLRPIGCGDIISRGD